MNLDDGGSTTMVVRNLVLNIPSDGSERAVSNAIVVIASPE
ncbi:MAG TPA: phosphodiester glycosidase family protein [Natronincola sp.]|nr:phosphodiester glycosidase family protein [Natronincola sp.]